MNTLDIYPDGPFILASRAYLFFSFRILYFDMNLWCQMHWRCLFGPWGGKALTALHAEWISLNVTMTVCLPQGIRDSMSPKFASSWRADWWSYWNDMVFGIHLLWRKEKKHTQNNGTICIRKRLSNICFQMHAIRINTLQIIPELRAFT